MFYLCQLYFSKKIIFFLKYANFLEHRSSIMNRASALDYEKSTIFETESVQTSFANLGYSIFFNKLLATMVVGVTFVNYMLNNISA